MVTKLYIALATLMIVGYMFINLYGWDIDSEEPKFVPASARQSPGGYRSFHFWHTGYSGGK